MKAILFDLDGVLIDSKKAHLTALAQMFKSKEISLTKEEISCIFGYTVEDNINTICAARGLHCPVSEWAKEKKQIALELLKKAEPFPGTEEFLKYVKTKYKIALATSSSIPEVDVSLKGLKRYFDLIVTREDVRKHKPDPEVYLFAAKMLGLKIKDCVVIEDSIAGVEAAKRAGIFCIAVLNSYPAKELKAADLIVTGLDDPKLREILSGGFLKQSVKAILSQTNSSV